jgi:hypothetical protein
MVIADLKQIIEETIGSKASHTLMSSLQTLLEKEKDLPQACTKIADMVGLFIGQDAAKMLRQKFREKL